MKYWGWIISRVRRKLWIQAVLYGLFGVVTALIATNVRSTPVQNLPFEVSSEAVDSLLNIIASSMLAVTTFSLGAVTAAFSGATSNVTPRATKLLMEDPVTHNVLSTFIGAFIFSIVSIITLKTGSYGEEGRAVLFFITIAIIALIVAQLLRWVNHLMSLGRVGATIERIEKVTSEAIKIRLESPYLGANPWLDDQEPPAGAVAVKSQTVGYLQFINIEQVSRLCEAKGLKAWIPLNPGSFCYEGTALVWIDAPIDDDLAAKLATHFIIDSDRTYDQDPRFGLSVMAEVAQRALSPAVNDPGTALDIIGRQTRLLSQWSEGREETEVEHKSIHVRPLTDQDLIEDAFMPIGRDGAGLIEIQLRLHKSLNALTERGSDAFRKAARAQARMIYERGCKALTATGDLERLDKAHRG